jgi:hypothetical protein
MPQAQVSFFQDGVERVRETVDSIEHEISRVQKELQKELRSRRRSLEKQLNASRRDLEKRTKRIRRDFQKNPTLKQVEGLRRRASQQIEQSVDGVLALFQIASKSDVERIDRKITQLNRRLRELDAKKRRAPRRA